MTLNDYQKAAERTSGNLTSWDTHLYHLGDFERRKRLWQMKL